MWIWISFLTLSLVIPKGFPNSAAGIESTCNAGDPGFIPGPRRSAVEGIGYPLQYSGLENPMESQRVRHDWETFLFPKVLLSVKLIFALCAYFSPSACSAFHHYCLFLLPGLPQGLSGKESACQCRKLAGDTGSIPGLGRYPGEGNGNTLLFSCLGSCLKRGAWWLTVHRVANSWSLNN